MSLISTFPLLSLKKKLISDTFPDTDVHKQTVNFRYALIVCSYIMHFVENTMSKNDIKSIFFLIVMHL